MTDQELQNKIDKTQKKYASILYEYQNEIDALYTEYYRKDTTLSLFDLLEMNNTEMDKFFSKSGLSAKEIEGFNNVEKVTLLAACKAAIGLKKCGIYATEESLLGSDRYDELQAELANRKDNSNLTAEDNEYLELSKRENICANLTYYRTQKGLSRNKLASLSGVSARTIETYESGHRNLADASATTVHALASALDCRIEDIIGKNHL